MTPLARQLVRRIAHDGPIGLDSYMRDCLLHPEHGYYTTAEPFGAEGDFTTAPEITQMFGELLGLWLAQCWLDQGAPNPFYLAELGPGRGTLMADALRAGRGVPGFLAAARPVLVEASPRLIARQRATLEGLDLPKPPRWIDRVEDLPEGPLFLLANEFFDALPIRQFQRHADGWQERVVGLAEAAGGAEGTEGPSLTLGLTPPARLGELAHRLADTGPGDVVEIRPAANAILATIAGRIAADGGAALIVDYGDWQSLGDTFQAVAGHVPVDPLAAPGQADLTAHVDFARLAEAAQAAGARATRMTTQGAFLEALGIGARAERLARTLAARPPDGGAAGNPALEAHLRAYRRLTHPDEMGSLFKTIAIHPIETSAPPGFGS